MSVEVLTESMVEQAKARNKSYAMSDGRGLLLEIRPNGGKYWIIRYWINKKERRTSAGIYPVVTLQEARTKNYEFRKALKAYSPSVLQRVIAGAAEQGNLNDVSAEL